MAYPFAAYHRAALHGCRGNCNQGRASCDCGPRNERDAHVELSEMPSRPARMFDPLSSNAVQRMPRRRARVSIGTKLIGIALAAAVLGTVFGPWLAR